MRILQRNSTLGKQQFTITPEVIARKMTKLDLTYLSELEKGYIIGLFLGDGDINKGRQTPRYIVRFSLDAKRDQDISVKLYQIFQKGHKKISVFTRASTLTVKVCSKELVDYIKTCIEYKKKHNIKAEKKLLISKNWPHGFQYGILAGIIDSDGHVQKHLGTEIKTVSPSIFKGILNVLKNLGIRAKTKRRKATENSYSKKIRYAIYIPSLQIKTHRNEIPSVKITRYL